MCRSWVLFGCLASFLACAPTGPSAASSDDDIRGAGLEKGYAAVGILRMENKSFCTGTLVAPDVVLTAAHCLRETAVSFHLGAGKRVTDFHSTDAIDTMTKYVVAEQVGYPSFNQPREARCPSELLDVALIKLAEPVRGVTPDVIDFRTPASSESCTTVGFGNHDGGFHEKRSATQKMRQLRATSFGFDAFRISTEGGDSGGPLFCNGAVVAVNSCGNAPDWYARLDVGQTWLEVMLTSWDPRAAAQLVSSSSRSDGGMPAEASDAGR